MRLREVSSGAQEIDRNLRGTSAFHAMWGPLDAMGVLRWKLIEMIAAGLGICPRWECRLVKKCWLAQ
jgi:hypothetical protein